MWLFKDKDTGTDFFRQGFNSWDLSRDPRVQSKTFDLEPGCNYRLVMQDSANNGICCVNGNGYITMSQQDDDTTILYERKGDFTDTLYVDVLVSVRGSISITEVNPPASPPGNVNTKPDWPGFFPSQGDHAFSLNVKLDTGQYSFVLLSFSCWL